MLAASHIPPSLRFCGEVREAPLPYPAFDFIFLLGVTSYIPRMELPALLEFLARHLSPGGKLVVSFTNRCSLDFQLRRALRFDKLLKITQSAQNRVIGQQFQIQAYCLSEIGALVRGIYQYPPVWLNHTISPLNHLFPLISVRFAKLIKRYFPTFLVPFLSSDYLLIFEKES